MSFAEIICPACRHSVNQWGSGCDDPGCYCYCVPQLTKAQADAILKAEATPSLPAQDALLATVWLALTSGQRGSIKTNAREAMVTLARYMRQDGMISAGALQGLETDNEVQRHRCPSSYQGKRCTRQEGHRGVHWAGEGFEPRGE